MVSVFDLFKTGIGPSSSHTMGPMIAARRFREHLVDAVPECTHVQVTLHGSLAWTGAGHGSNLAICLGLLGEAPETVDPSAAPALMAALEESGRIVLTPNRSVDFQPARDLKLDRRTVLPRHSNGMRFTALDGEGRVLETPVYYSIGGGFVLREDEQAAAPMTVPLPFDKAAEMLKRCAETGLLPADLQRRNEHAARTDAEIDAGLDGIRDAMFACIDRGLATTGMLPGGLKVKRRAHDLRERLLAAEQGRALLPHERMDWVSLYAIAVNEENAAGGRVVTAPTNGAAGILPAVLRYYRDVFPEYTAEGSRTFLLTAAAIGGIIKRNASISGAEVGCQGETGSAAAIAAAGLAAVSGATAAQIENAAEIALEHHLGMTCDPIGGLVQIPCIERNAIGAQKAIAAASLALRGDGEHRVTLDEVIETMRQTGRDMKAKYKETSRGGLAVNVAEC